MEVQNTITILVEKKTGMQKNKVIELLNESEFEIEFIGEVGNKFHIVKVK